MKPVDNAKVLDDVRPAVPTFKAHWPDCGVVELNNGGTCTIAACNSLVAAGALAGSFMLKEEEMLGNGGLPYLRCRPETLEYWRRHPEKVTPPVTYLLETMALLMTTNNKVKKVLEHYKVKKTCPLLHLQPACCCRYLQATHHEAFLSSGLRIALALRRRSQANGRAIP